MTSFISRDPRIETDLKVHVGVQEIPSRQLITPLVTGRLRTISTTGACIGLPRIIINTTHLFFATLNNQKNQLLLSISLPDSEEEFAEIAAKPIWMNTWRINKNMEFRIGLHFIAKQQKLHKIIKRLF